MKSLEILENTLKINFICKKSSIYKTKILIQNIWLTKLDEVLTLHETRDPRESFNNQFHLPKIKHFENKNINFLKPIYIKYAECFFFRKDSILLTPVSTMHDR